MNREQLLNTLKSFQESSQPVKEPKELDYVLYARKSTEDKDKQKRSLGDQISECKELAERKNLNIAEVVKESQSAKEPKI